LSRYWSYSHSPPPQRDMSTHWPNQPTHSHQNYNDSPAPQPAPPPYPQDNLVDKSNDLSLASQMFYKQAKKTNSCC